MHNISNTVERKFIESFDVTDWEVETDTGFHPVTHIHKTIPYQRWKVLTETGLELECADDHILFDENVNEIFVKSLIPNQSKIITVNGVEMVVGVVVYEDHQNMYDLTVDSDDHRFFTNGILSHNSTILDALTFSLFGKPFRNINKPQLVNGTNQRECLVEIEFKIGPEQYLVRRGIKPNIFEIIRNGKAIEQDAKVTDFQAYLEKNILGLNYKTFTQIVILGSASYVPFMQLRAADRREVIEDLLDITIFSAMNTVLKQDAVLTKEEIRSIEQKAAIVNERIKMQKKFLQDARVQVKQLIEDKMNEVKVSEAEVEAHLKIIEQTERDIKKLQAELVNLVTSDVNTMRAELGGLRSDKRKLEKELDFFVEHSDCPTCKQSIEEFFKETMVQKNHYAISKTELAIEGLVARIEAQEKLLNERERVQKQIAALQSRLISEQSAVTFSHRSIQKLNEEIVKLQNTGETQTESAQDELDILNQNLNELAKEHKTKTYHKGLQEVAAELLKDSGIKTKIIRQYLPAINQLINKYLKELQFPITFNLDEEFKETIESRFGDTFSYASFSEGQKMRVDLAVLFTWVEIARMKNSVNTNLLFFDEVFDSSLDEEGTDDFMKIIRSFGAGMNIFTISHKGDQLMDRFDDVITFEMHKGFSRAVPKQ